MYKYISNVLGLVNPIFKDGTAFFADISSQDKYLPVPIHRLDMIKI